MHPLLDLSAIDPELLRARLTSLQQPARGHAISIVDATLRCAARLQEVDLQTLESELQSKGPSSLWSGVNDAVAALWLSLEELQQAMQPLVNAHEAARPAAEDELSFEAVQPAAAQAVGPLDTTSQRIAETAWTLGFVLSGEVQSWRRRLQSILRLQDGWELLGALQDHLGHLRAALGAVLAGIYAALPGSAGAAGAEDESFELLSSRELRSRVFELRDAVAEAERRLKNTPPHARREELARVHALVERFTFGPGFAWMRATDKRAFLAQRRTLGEILELYSPLRAEPARQSIENLARFLEALQVVNQRECLLKGDRAALSLVIEKMRLAVAAPGAPESRAAIAAALAALAEAQGRDAELDGLLTQTLAPGSPVPVEQILARAEAVLGGMCGQG